MSKRKDTTYRSGRSPDWLKMKNPNAEAVKREEGPFTRIQAVSIALFSSSASAAAWALMASPSPLRLADGGLC